MGADHATRDRLWTLAERYLLPWVGKQEQLTVRVQGGDRTIEVELQQK